MRKKKSNILLMTLVMLVLALALTACGGSDNKSNEGGGEKDKETGAPIVNAEDITYEIGNTRFEDYRAASIAFTNNTDYEIISFNMILGVKDKIKGVKGDSVSTDSEMIYLVKPGEKSPYVQIYDDDTYDGIPPAKDMESKLEPDTLTIVYKEKDSKKTYEMTHDYINKETSYGESDYVFNKWKNKLAKNYPKPDSDYILIKEDGKEEFEALVLGAGKSDWEKYAKECYKAGLKEFDEKYTDDSYYGDHPKTKDTVQLEFVKDQGYRIEITHY